MPATSRQGRGSRASASYLPGSLGFWPAPQQKVSDYLSAAHDSAHPRVAASWRRCAARGLVRMGDATCRYTD